MNDYALSKLEDLEDDELTSYDEVLFDLADTLEDLSGAPTSIIVPAVLRILDTAQAEGRLTGRERIDALDWMSENYGYNF